MRYPKQSPDEAHGTLEGYSVPHLMAELPAETFCAILDSHRGHLLDSRLPAETLGSVWSALPALGWCVLHFF
ncbi:hypothetical protein AV530_004521 [Patagioenas fasciata monilis]|uniref:Uncharacterized protein n=1 Tax=Patagioenas fasciata monilis TaxID=372326 RepID=A0A1V4J6U3_PATFA|nr:hypothetical protein AV530_004521 [Patagioenas fasciata monilis]